MRYFRYYPWAMQLLLLLAMSFTFYFFGIWMLQMLMPKTAGIPLESLTTLTSQSPYFIIRTTLIVLGILSLLRFGITAGVFGYLTHPRPAAYLGLNPPKKVFQVVLAAVVMIAFIPALEWLQEIMSHIGLTKAFKASEEENERMMQALLTIPSAGDVLLVLLVMAIIPAIGEELFFRGVLLRFVSKSIANPYWPIMITAIIFAISHGNIYGMLSIFIAGFLLGLTYYLTGSLWCSIAGHVGFNATSIGMAYLGTHDGPLHHFFTGDHIPVWLMLVSFAAGSGALYLLFLNQTPLPTGWTHDFDEQDSEMDLLQP